MKLLSLGLTETMREVQASTKTLTLQQPDSWAEILQTFKSSSGQNVNAQTAMRASSVLACIRILVEDIAALPLVLKRTTPTGPVDATEHPLFDKLKTVPNAFQTSVELREHMMLDTLLFGRFANWVQRDGSGMVTAISPLMADALTWVGPLPNGDIAWQYSTPYLTRRFTQSDLWRGSMLSRTTFEGQSLILLAREAIGLAMAAEEQGARLFSNGIQSDLVLEYAETLDDPSRQTLKKALNDAYSGSQNAFRALVLDNGLTAKRIGLTAVESQFLEARNYQLADIARIFRIPSVMLGIVGDKANTYASTEQFFLSYEKHCIRPWCNRIEQTISRDLILPGEKGLFAKHDLTDLLRADMKTRFEAYGLGINAGWVKLNEPRQWEGLQTDSRLDIFLRNLNTTEVGKPNPEPTNPAAPGNPNAPKTPPPTPPAPKQQAGTRLALIAAATVLGKERKWFDRQDKGEVTAEQLAGFSAWHNQMVSDVTGADAADIQAYCAWRADHKTDDQAATNQLVSICLKGAENEPTI
jgi:HK97 family phage portal protein